MRHLPLSIAIVTTAMWLAGCASAHRMHAPDGQARYVINCSGAYSSWPMCHQKAALLCGGNGYDVHGKADGTEPVVVGDDRYGLYGSYVHRRSIVVACR